MPDFFFFLLLLYFIYYSNEIIGCSSKYLGNFMKIYILFLLFTMQTAFIIDASSNLEYKEPTALCLGNIVFQAPVQPHLRIYYKGNRLSLDMNSKGPVKIVPYSLTENKSAQQFHILISSQCTFANQEFHRFDQDNTVQSLIVPKNIPYKFYTLSAARQYNKDNEVDGFLWTVTDELLLDDRILPDNTIIFLFDANLIEKLNVKSWPQNSNTRLLPDIIIKNIPHDKILRAITNGLLAGIDLDAIHHHHNVYIKKMENQAVLSMMS